jgi:hypothetical protein
VCSSCATDFEYTSYPIEDTHEGEPNAYFEQSVEVLAKIKADRSLIFVHCTEGKNIAPTIVLNYMMQSAKQQNKHLSLLQAYNFLGSKAPGIKVEDYFMEQLLGQCRGGMHHRSLLVHPVSLLTFIVLVRRPLSCPSAEVEEDLFEETSIKIKGSGKKGFGGGSRAGVGRGGRGGRGGKGKRGK